MVKKQQESVANSATEATPTKKEYKNVFIRGITRVSGKYINASLSVDDLKLYANDKWFVNVSFAPLKELGAFNKTHTQYVSVPANKKVESQA